MWRYRLEHWARRAMGVHTCRAAGATWWTPTPSALQVARHFGRSQPLLREFLERIPPGGVLYDVGANVGVYAVQAATKGCPVEAFEPAASCHAALVRNVELNGVTVSTHQLAISNRDATVSFFAESDDPATETGHVGEESHGYPAGALWVPRPQVSTVAARSIDSLVADGLRSPAALKVDVEGHEAAVLDGAVQALRSVAVVLVEIHPDRLPAGETERTLLARLEAADLAEIAREQRGRQLHVLAIDPTS